MFDVEGARKAGYSDAEIADHLAASRKFDVGGARSAGYSDADIVAHLTSMPTGTPPGPSDFAERRSQVGGQFVSGLVNGPPVTNQREAFMSPGAIPSAAMGALRGAKDVVDTGASLLSGAVAGPDEKARIDAMNAAGKSAYDAMDKNPVAAGAGRIGGQLAAVNPLIKGVGMAAGAVSPMLGQAIQTSGTLRSLPMPARMAGGAVAGGLTAGAVNPEDALAGAAVGGVAPPVFDAASAVGRRIAAPVKSYLSQSQDIILKHARDMGFKVTPATETLNPTLMRTESWLHANPLTGARFDAIGKHNQQRLNQIAAKEIGQNATELSSTVLGKAADDIGKKFESISQAKIPLGQPFADDLANVAKQYSSVWGGRGDTKVASMLEDAVAEAKRGAISGGRYSELRSELSKVARDAYNGQNSRLGEAAEGFIDALDRAAVSGLTAGQAKTIAEARAQWKTLLNIERSLNGENLSASKMVTTLRRADPRGFLRGGRQNDLYDAVRFGDQFKSIVGDSGTATRLGPMVQLGAASGLGAGIGNVIAGPGGAAVGSVAMPLATTLGPAAYLSEPMLRYLSRQRAAPAAIGLPNASRAAPLLGPAAAGLLSQETAQ